MPEHWIVLVASPSLLTCGHVGCCDSSPNRHATKHFEHTTHPVMASFERGERWAWCYVDQMELDVPARVAKSLREGGARGGRGPWRCSSCTNT
jgi:hypothetical protein